MTTTADDVAKLLRDLRHHRNEIGHYTGFEFVHALRDTLEALQAEVAAANKDRDNALAISQMTHRQWREAEAAEAKAWSAYMRAAEAAHILHNQLASWQPIETAPISKNVLVYVPDALPDDRVMVAINLEPEPHAADGWYTENGFGDLVDPTHWMPLPEPPKQETKP